jgi:hypothetical protein
MEGNAIMKASAGNLAGEKLLTMSQAAVDVTDRLPGRRGGRKAHSSTLTRWGKRGLRGIKLEVLRVGGTLATSREALDRFFMRLADSEPAAESPVSPAAQQSKSNREDRIAAAKEVLAKAGIN